MVDLSLLTLADFPAFAPLEDIAKRTGCTLTLHGGAASRALLFAAYRDRTDFDIFDVAPFNSDIDIEHNGPRQRTFDIATEIEQHVPFASWCRWSIIDKERSAQAELQRASSTYVPLRRIRLTTGKAAHIPDAAMADLTHRRVSCFRNPAFERGRFADVELFGLMMALNTGIEAENIAGGEFDANFPEWETWLAEDLHPSELKLATNPIVAARFWHLLSSRLARRGPDRLHGLLTTKGRVFLDALGISPAELAESTRAISVSKITSASRFRVLQTSPQIISGEPAAARFAQIMRDAVRQGDLPPGKLPDNPLDLIDPALELVAVISDLTLLPSETGVRGAWGSGHYSDQSSLLDDNHTPQEFMQIAWEIPPMQKLDADGLTAHLVVPGGKASTAALVVGGTFDENRAWLRARLNGLIDTDPLGAPRKLAVLILQARTAESTDMLPGRQRTGNTSNAEAVVVEPQWNYGDEEKEQEKEEEKVYQQL